MFHNKFNSKFSSRFSKNSSKSNKSTNTNTNITVEKIDTTETALTSKKNESSNNKLKESSKKNTSQQKESGIKKLTVEEEIINNIETLEDLPLVLSNVSENEKHSMIDTDTLLYAKKKNKKEKNINKHTLDFPKTEIVDYDKYNTLNKYVKKNYNSIVDLLYKKKLLKNKNTPYRIVYHIYVNYLNEDLNIIIY